MYARKQTLLLCVLCGVTNAERWRPEKEKSKWQKICQQVGQQSELKKICAAKPRLRTWGRSVPIVSLPQIQVVSWKVLSLHMYLTDTTVLHHISVEQQKWANWFSPLYLTGTSSELTGHPFSWQVQSTYIMFTSSELTNSAPLSYGYQWWADKL